VADYFSPLSFEFNHGIGIIQMLKQQPEFNFSFFLDILTKPVKKFTKFLPDKYSKKKLTC